MAEQIYDFDWGDKFAKWFKKATGPEPYGASGSFGTPDKVVKSGKGASGGWGGVPSPSNTKQVLGTDGKEPWEFTVDDEAFRAMAADKGYVKGGGVSVNSNTPASSAVTTMGAAKDWEGISDKLMKKLGLVKPDDFDKNGVEYIKGVDRTFSPYGQESVATKLGSVAALKLHDSMMKDVSGYMPNAVKADVEALEQPARSAYYQGMASKNIEDAETERRVRPGLITGQDLTNKIASERLKQEKGIATPSATTAIIDPFELPPEAKDWPEAKKRKYLEELRKRRAGGK